MVEFCCIMCSYQTEVKGNYIRHLKSTKHLRNKVIYGGISKKTQKDPEKTQKDPEKTQKDPGTSQKDPNGCIFCGNLFSTFAHKRRHELHRCKDKAAIKQRKKINHELEIKELKREHKKMVESLLSKVGYTNIITTTNNLNLNSYGNEDISHITDTFKTKMLNMPYQMIPKMIEQVHFNENKPENKNIIISNKKENKIKIFSNNKWIYRNKDDVLNDLIDGKYFMIDNHYETVCNKIKNKRYENFRTKYDKKDKSIIEQIKSESELVILNNR